MSSFDPFSWGDIDETKLVQISSAYDLAKIPAGSLIYTLDSDGDRSTRISRGYEAEIWAMEMREFPGTLYYVIR